MRKLQKSVQFPAASESLAMVKFFSIAILLFVSLFLNAIFVISCHQERQGGGFYARRSEHLLDKVHKLEDALRARDLAESLSVVEDNPLTDSALLWGECGPRSYDLKVNYDLPFLVFPKEDSGMQCASPCWDAR